MEIRLIMQQEMGKSLVLDENIDECEARIFHALQGQPGLVVVTALGMLRAEWPQGLKSPSLQGIGLRNAAGQNKLPL